MFELQNESLDERRLRSRYEPLAEIFQMRGSSECLNPGPEDPAEDCRFEPWLGDVSRPYSPSKAASLWGRMKKGYLRSALDAGLSAYQGAGFNPLQLGFVAGTDNHMGLPGFVNETAIEPVIGPAWARLLLNPRYNPGGLTAIHAAANTRESLFEALKRRDTYATSGPRIKLDFFQTRREGDLCASGRASSDVPMGGVFSKSAAPKFVVSAEQDQVPLSRVEIIKGVFKDGKALERIFTLQAMDAVNGDARVCRVWVDPSYDPSAPAYYYARVLEIPTPRWSAYDCWASPGDCRPRRELEVNIQERAWSSPIWAM
jgi:hypothetical protein